jgi:hypothetical protein
MFNTVYDRIKPLIRVSIIVLFVWGLFTKSLFSLLLIMYTVAFQFLCFSIIEWQNSKKVLSLSYFTISIIIIVYYTSKIL